MQSRLKKETFRLQLLPGVWVDYHWISKFPSDLKAISLKPSRYNLLVEQSPLFFLEKMKAASSLTKLKTSTSYMNKREELIRNLRVLFNKLKFRNQTFYLAVLMMDLILCNHQETKLELVSVVCLILAGNDVVIQRSLMKTTPASPT